MSTIKVSNIQNGSATNVAMVLDTAGTVKAYSTISVGNVTPSSSGAGITFPATQSASSDANTLDDYEEGDWTPTLTGGTTAGTTTYTAQYGSYIKIGKQVTVFFELRATAATGTGEWRLGGLPFTIGNANKYQSCGAVMIQDFNWSGGTSPVVYANPNSTFLNLYISGDDINWANQNMVNETQFYIGSITYTASA